MHSIFLVFYEVHIVMYELLTDCFSKENEHKMTIVIVIFVPRLRITSSSWVLNVLPLACL